MGTTGGGLVAVVPAGRSDQQPATTLLALAAALPCAAPHLAGLHPTSFRCRSHCLHIPSRL